MNLQSNFNYLSENYQTFAQYPKLVKKAQSSPWSGSKDKKDKKDKKGRNQDVALCEIDLTEREIYEILEKKKSEGKLEKIEEEGYAHLSQSEELLIEASKTTSSNSTNVPISKSYEFDTLIYKPLEGNIPFNFFGLKDFDKDPLLAELKEIFNQEFTRTGHRLKTSLPNRDTFNIFSLDGGGVKTVAQAVIVERIVQAVPNFLDKVDLFVGVSSGSGPAMAYCLGASPYFVSQTCRWLSKAVFSHPEHSKLNITKPTYSSKYISELTSLLKLCYNVQSLKDFPRDIAIPAYKAGLANFIPQGDTNDLHTGEELFTRWGARRDTDLVHVALRTSAAPSYFEAYQGYLDGGLISSNPLPSVIPDVIGPNGLNVPIPKIRIFSLGNPTAKKNIQPFFDKDGNWGIAQWAPRILDLFFQADLKSSNNQMKTLFGSNYCRLDPLCEESIELDDYEKLSKLIEIGSSVNLEATVEWLKKNW